MSRIFLPYDQFSWFREAPIGKVVHVELPFPGHLYWPELDVDLEVESILYPDRYSLVSRVHEARQGYVAVELDQDKIDECVLALLQLTLHDGARENLRGQDYRDLSFEDKSSGDRQEFR